MENAEAIWTAKSDDELLEATSELFDYTEEGERIIRAELHRRGLPEPDPPIGKCSRCGRSIAANHPGDRCSECEEPFTPEILRMLGGPTPEPALVSVLSTENAGLVPLVTSVLDKEGIEHLVRGSGVHDPFGGGSFGRYGTGPIDICVAETDARRARELIDGLRPQRPLSEQLSGRWALESVTAVDGSEVEYPMGHDIEGVITYEPSGHMAVQMMRHDRPLFASGDVDRATPAELSAAVAGYTAYFGTYSVDENASVVTHHVKGSLFPNWVGTDQPREILVEGDRLTLTSQPILFDGKIRVFRVAWRRD